MTNDFDKTMNDLLRRQGRRGEASFADAHLDADALNAFAENALPQATRLRYMAHLADCASCRKLATELTLTAAAVREETAAASIKPPTIIVEENSWRAWFGAFFNPAVLRFAVPAVALFAVTVGAFVALRSNRETAQTQTASNTEAPANRTQEETVAKVEPSVAAQSPLVAAAPAPPPNQTTQPKPNEPAPAATVAPELGENEKGRADDKNAPLEKRDKDLGKERKNAAPQPEAAPLSDTRRQIDELPRTTPPPSPVTPGNKPPSGPQRGRDLQLDGVVSSDDAVARQEAGKRENRATGSASGGRGPSKPVMSDNGNLTAPKATAPAAASETSDEESDANTPKAKKRPAPAATRNAGGRSFIRRGNAWIDTACANGCATTTLRRGSDEYKRADAGLRSIADQLGGEVVVIWQGKAYRIQ
jgi:hypothetical protein